MRKINPTKTVWAYKVLALGVLAWKILTTKTQNQNLKKFKAVEQLHCITQSFKEN